MRLVTFQSFDFLKTLFDKGYLECDSKKINLNKVGYAYDWIVEKMNETVKNSCDVSYPIWCWVKCYNGICPKRRKGKKVEGFDVKITFNKDEKDVFITDFRRYSFLLNNIYIPSNISDLKKFDSILKKNNISNEDLKKYVRRDKYNNCRNDKEFLEVCSIIRKSFDKCVTKNSDILQGCVWRIYLEEIEKIEILDNDYICGSLNYVRSNGERFNWINDYYKLLK